MTKQQLSFRPYINNEDRQEHGSSKRFTENIHHCVPISRNVQGKLGPTIKLYEDVHSSYHRLFGNLVFQEAILQMLKINGPALSDKYTKDIQEIINMDSNYIYKDGIWLKK